MSFRRVPLYSGCLCLLFAVSVLFATVGVASAGVRLRVAYEDELTAGVLASLVTKVNQSELDFVMNGGQASAYAVKDGEATLIGSRASGRGYYYGPCLVTMKTRPEGLDFTAEYRTHVTTLSIRTDGRTYCRPHISFRLKPGQTSYQYELPVLGTIDVYRIVLRNISCEISSF